MGRDEIVGEEDCLALNVHTDQVGRVADETVDITKPCSNLSFF